jgi:DnaK suppressor protein
MNQIDIDAHKAALESRRETIMQDLAPIAEHNPATDDWEMKLDSTEFSDADDNVAGDEGEEAEERIATLALLETEYRLVVLALKKIELGTYGVCDVCGEAIEANRLAVEPAARTCIAHREDEIDLPLV